MLEEFLDKYFEPWLKELADNERGFNPFNLSEKNDFTDLIKGFKLDSKVLPGLISKPFDTSDIFVNMAKNERQFSYLNKVNKRGEYISMAFDAINKSVFENIQF